MLASQGVIQNFHASTHVTTVAGATQTIPGGPVASQLSIKQLGTNGGGFFNTNSSHPFENPNGLHEHDRDVLHRHDRRSRRRTRSACCIKGKKFGWVIFGVMFTLLIISIGVAVGAEIARQPAAQQGRRHPAGHRDTSRAATWRARRSASAPPPPATWAGATTGSSNGSVNSFHDSFTPIGGLVPLTNLLLGEVTPGGVGVGLTGILVLALLTVFIAGLMVGRTPEFLGKKIQGAEMKMVVLHILFAPLVILGFAAASVVLKTAVTCDLQLRAARSVGDRVRVRVVGRQQRLGVRRLRDEHELVQHDDGHHDARRAVLPDHPDARDLGLARAQAGDTRDRRHVPAPTRRCSAGCSPRSS